MNKKAWLLGLAVFTAGLLVFFLIFSLLMPQARARLTAADYQAAAPKTLSYVAVGDSLTEGVGDSTQRGGFVPLLAEALQTDYGYTVTPYNFGVAGNTSRQILKRMQETADLQAQLAQADLMTLTVGGNDVMAVVRKNLTSLESSSFEEPRQTYQANLTAIIELARKENPDLPIYVLGIYNPFYLSFPEAAEATQAIIDRWNQATEETLAQFDRVSFVPINDRLYQGVDGQGGISELEAGQGDAVNDALFEGDNFHPNNVGYQIMQAAILEKMNETKQVWQKTEP